MKEHLRKLLAAFAPGASEATQASAVEEVDAMVQRIAELEEALRWLSGRQAHALTIIERNGFVFDAPLGAEHGNWQNLAFSLYTDICEIDTVARTALGE